MTLNIFRDEAAAFLKKVDPTGNESLSDILVPLDHEYEDLKACLENPARMSHQIYDMLFLLLELAANLGTDLDAEWALGRERKKKYSTTPYVGFVRKNNANA